MKRILKYVLGITDFQTIEMPEGAEILTAQLQFGRLCIWVMVEEGPLKPRLFEILGTGNQAHELNALQSREFISTVQDGRLVWHLFEIKIAV